MFIFPLVFLSQRNLQEFFQDLEGHRARIVWQGVLGSEERHKQVVRYESAQERQHPQTQLNGSHSRRKRNPSARTR